MKKKSDTVRYTAKQIKGKDRPRRGPDGLGQSQCDDRQEAGSVDPGRC